VVVVVVVVIVVVIVKSTADDYDNDNDNDNDLRRSRDLRTAATDCLRALGAPRSRRSPFVPAVRPSVPS
jgi:hypothetical protein